jgi:hypothetical protein
MAEYIAIERTNPETGFWLFCCRSNMAIKDQAGNNFPFLNQLTGASAKTGWIRGASPRFAEDN